MMFSAIEELDSNFKVDILGNMAVRRRLQRLIRLCGLIRFTDSLR